jgi:hypothetical protein
MNRFSSLAVSLFIVMLTASGGSAALIQYVWAPGQGYDDDRNITWAEDANSA